MTESKETSQLNALGKSKYKCPMHNFWLKKGQCEICRLEVEKQQREYEKTGGANKPPVRVGKL